MPCAFPPSEFLMVDDGSRRETRRSASGFESRGGNDYPFDCATEELLLNAYHD